MPEKRINRIRISSGQNKLGEVDAKVLGKPANSPAYVISIGMYGFDPEFEDTMIQAFRDALEGIGVKGLQPGSWSKIGGRLFCKLIIGSLSVDRNVSGLTDLPIPGMAKIVCLRALELTQEQMTLIRNTIVRRLQSFDIHGLSDGTFVQIKRIVLP